MTLPIDPSIIPIDPNTNNPVPVCDVFQRETGIIERSGFSVIGPTIKRESFSLDEGIPSILEFSTIISSSRNSNLGTVWTNLITGEEVTRRFYLAGALNTRSLLSCSCQIVELIYDTQIHDPDYIDYINNGINGIIKDLNNAHEQQIMQTVNPNEPPEFATSGISGPWNGVTEEAFEVKQLNDAMTAYVNDPSNPTKQADFNTAITTYETYANQRNTMIAAYNTAVANYNNNVGSVNQSIDEFNAHYEGYAIIGPIDTLQESVDEYQSLAVGLPPSPTPVTIPYQLSQYVSIEIPVISDIYLSYNIMNFFLELGYTSGDPPWGLGSNVQTGIDIYNNDYVIDNPPAVTEQSAVNDLNVQIALYNAGGAIDPFIQAVQTYNDLVNNTFNPLILGGTSPPPDNSFNTSIVDVFNSGNVTIPLTSPSPPYILYFVTIPESRPEAINLIINAVNPYLSTIPEVQYTAFPVVAPGVTGIYQRELMEVFPTVDPLNPPTPGNVAPLDPREAYPQVPDFTPPYLPDDQYTSENLTLLQAMPFPDVTNIPPISNPPDYDDPTDFSTINGYFDELNDSIDDYNTNEIPNENAAIDALNQAITNWNNAVETLDPSDSMEEAQLIQARADLQAASDAYTNQAINTLNPIIDQLNGEVTVFNTATVPPPNGESLAALNAEITMQNEARAFYGLTPIPLYSPKPTRDNMPISPVDASVTLSTTVNLVSSRVDYTTVPEMTQYTINDNYIINGANDIECSNDDILAFTRLQFNDPNYLDYRDLLTSGGLNIEYNNVANIYLEADGAPWPTGTYFGIPPPPVPTTPNMSEENQAIMNEWLSQVIAQMPYETSILNPSGAAAANAAALTTLQGAIDEFNAYTSAINGVIDTYNASIDAVNERVGIESWGGDKDSEITFSTYGTIAPPDVLTSKTVDGVILLPPPPTTTTSVEQFVLIDQAGQDEVAAWIQAIQADGSISQQDKDAAQAEADAYDTFVLTTTPEPLPDTLNGYAAAYNSRYEGLGLVGPLKVVDLLEPIQHIAPLPSISDPLVVNKTITNGTDTITGFNAYQTTGFLYTVANYDINGNIFPPLLEDLNSVNDAILNYNNTVRGQETAIIAAYNDAIDVFNDLSSSDYFDELNDLTIATVLYYDAITVSPPSESTNNVFLDFNENSLDLANNGSRLFGSGVAGFIESANEILDSTGIPFGPVTTLSELEPTPDMPPVVGIQPTPIPNNVDQRPEERSLYPLYNFSTGIQSLVSNVPSVLPLFFTFRVDSIDPARSGKSDLDYITEEIYNKLVGVPYPNASESIIPDYNSTNSKNEGLHYERDVGENLQSAVDTYNEAVDAFNEGTISAGDLSDASDDLKDAVTDYIHDIETVSGHDSVDENIRDLNAEIDEWTEALLDANERLEFWGFAPFPDVYEINSRDLMPPPPVPYPNAQADYDPENPPSFNGNRSEQDYPSTQETLTDADGNPLYLDQNGNYTTDPSLSSKGEPIKVIVPLELDLEALLDYTAQQEGDTQFAVQYDNTLQLMDILESFERIIQYRIFLSGKVKEVAPAIVAKLVKIAFTSAERPIPGLAELSIGLTSPSFDRQLVTAVLLAAEVRSEARFVSGFSGSLSLHIKEVLEKTSFLATTDIEELLTGFLPSLIDAKEEDILDAVDAGLAFNFLGRTLDFINSDLSFEALKKILPVSRSSGRLLNILGDDLQFINNFVKLVVVLKALVQFARLVFPPQFFRSLIGEIPALENFLRGAVSNFDIRSLRDRVTSGNIRQNATNINNATFYTPEQFVLAASDRFIRGVKGQIPAVWVTSQSRGFKRYTLPSLIFKEKAFKTNLTNAEVANRRLDELILANTTEPPPPPIPAPKPNQRPDLAAPQPVEPPSPPTFDPAAIAALNQSLKDSIEESEINRRRIIDDFRDASYLKADNEKRVINSNLQAARIRADQNARSELSRSIRNENLADDIQADAIEDDIQSDAIDDAIEQKRVADEAALNSYLDAQRQTRQAVLSDLESEFIKRGVIQDNEDRTLQQKKLIETTRLQKANQERDILHGLIVSQEIAQTALTKSLIGQGLASKVAERIAQSTRTEVPPNDGTVSAQQLKESVISDNAERFNLVKGSELKEKISADNLQKREMNRRQNKAAVDRDINKLINLAISITDEFLKRIDDDKREYLAEHFRTMISDWADEQRTRYQAKSAAYRIGGPDSITPVVDRDTSIHI